MSDRSLTGYDNADVNSGQPDEEVYSYDALSKRLVCASCNPTGARPLGERSAIDSLGDLSGAWFEGWVSASVPGWIASKYQPRYLSDNGRVFFDSSDALVPQDTNGIVDVYEYEPEGVGTCTSASETYSEKSAGCISLISGGTGEQESVFADASVNGNDVFFVTSERLVGSDVDKAYDMYDAHACTSGVPCLPAEAVVPPACETADTCKGAPTPQPSVFGSPASATFAGAGNVVPASSVTPVKAKTKPKKKTKAKKKARSKKKKTGGKDEKKRVRKSASRSDKSASERGVR